MQNHSQWISEAVVFVLLVFFLSIYRSSIFFSSQGDWFAPVDLWTFSNLAMALCFFSYSLYIPMNPEDPDEISFISKNSVVLIYMLLWMWIWVLTVYTIKKSSDVFVSNVIPDEAWRNINLFCPCHAGCVSPFYIWL